MYKEDLTQEQNILQLLKERGSKGVYIYEMMTPKPHGLGIAQYNARIKGLRDKGHDIRNVKEGHFVYFPQDLPLLEDLTPVKEVSSASVSKSSRNTSDTHTTDTRPFIYEFNGNSARKVFV